MEKPPLETIIEALKKIDLERWEVVGNNFDAKNPVYKPAFRLSANGINFSVSIKDTTSGVIIYNYYSLSIKDWDQKTRIAYKDRKNKPEQKQLEKFYEYLSTNLKKREEEAEIKKEKEFEQILNKLLSD